MVASVSMAVQQHSHEQSSGLMSNTQESGSYPSGMLFKQSEFSAVRTSAQVCGWAVVVRFLLRFCFSGSPLGPPASRDFWEPRRSGEEA